MKAHNCNGAGKCSECLQSELTLARATILALKESQPIYWTLSDEQDSDDRQRPLMFNFMRVWRVRRYARRYNLGKMSVNDVRRKLGFPAFCTLVCGCPPDHCYAGWGPDAPCREGQPIAKSSHGQDGK